MALSVVWLQTVQNLGNAYSKSEAPFKTIWQDRQVRVSYFEQCRIAGFGVSGVLVLFTSTASDCVAACH